MIFTNIILKRTRAMARMEEMDGGRSLEIDGGKTWR